MKYYLMTPRDGSAFGVASAPSELDIIEVVSLLKEGCVVDRWKRIDFTLKDGGHSDFQANDLALRIFSSKLRSVLEEAKHPSDEFQWLPVRVSRRNYSVLHLPGTVAISKSKSRYYKDILLAPVIIKGEKAEVFKRTPDHPYETIVSRRVRMALEAAGCVGLDFEEVASE